jgi:hypothetical protein
MTIYGSPKSSVILNPGKTARDREQGAHKRQAANAVLRAEWSRETHRGRSKGAVFPIQACNGRKTRALRAAAKRRPHKQKGK